MYTVYILQSAETGLYYTGYTSGTVENRLARHLSYHRGFTAKAKDWYIVWVEKFETKKEAVLEEKRIKKRGAGRYLASKEIK